MVELVTEATTSQLGRRLGVAWEEGLTKTVQNVVVIGESFVHPEVEDQLLYANNIGHEVRWTTIVVTLTLFFMFVKKFSVWNF